MTPVTVIYHPKERWSKCSLRHLRSRDDIKFYKAGTNFTFEAHGFILLHPDAPPLRATDFGPPLLILDCAWRLLPSLERCLVGNPLCRSLPPEVKTSYPRKSKIFSDPENGLASVEALYLARKILGHDDPTVLEGYTWKEQFLTQKALYGGTTSANR